MDIVISVISTTATTVISGVILFLMKRFFTEQRRKEERRDKAKERDNVLILKAINALGKLTVADSIALRDGKTNGEMIAALEEYREVERELYEHLIGYHAKRI
ncbi:MAG: hypothetical protein E7679_06925 [Ruminococcaceae bacterium]|nr:hypothetical protein [Oscillospiraceae bacterium]